ncbi:AMP-binding protein [Nonomuraea sp. NPDC050153]|uniref:AMP-binding protein n=1 Tax=Nonomuraea sp. NPDC050153 TaxID=3364359 RepID=UPI0037B4B695
MTGLRDENPASQWQWSDGDVVPADWNATTASFDDQATLPDLIEEAVNANPEAIAIETSDGSCTTFGQLWSRAQQLSNALIEEGLGPGHYVGVLVEHSVTAIVAILGVTCSGAAYVPLDPRWPASRVAEPISQLRINWIMTSRRHARLAEESAWIAGEDTRLMCLDATQHPVDYLEESSTRLLWDEIAADDDPLRAAGFNQGQSEEGFESGDVAVYLDHVRGLVASVSNPHSLLEIGCGSGLVAAELGGLVAEYVGVDPSPVAIDRCRSAMSESSAVTHFYTGFAHDILEIADERRFDAVLMSSVTQFYPGPDYARKAILDAIGLVNEGGAVIIADVIDTESKTGEGHLRLPRSWFQALTSETATPVDVEIVARNGEHWHGSLAGRYDVVIRRAASPSHAPAHDPKPRVLTWASIERFRDIRTLGQTSSSDPAYVIFTSGSTGRPKGVQVCHRSVVNLIEWVNKTYSVCPEDRLLLVTAFTFDLSVYDIFGILAAGGTIRVISQTEMADPDRVLEILDREKITFWDSAPAALSQVMAVASGRQPPQSPGLRLVFLSGDWVPLSLPDDIRRRFPAAHVVALGGATEATVWSNYFDVGEVDADWPSIPYGRPIQNARYYVLNSDRTPCVIGQPGDLYIAGVPVAMGYAGDSELTDARFVADPFVSDPKSRMYFTGDRARWIANGTMQFLGRLDDQVKIRGYRIELGDVQATLNRIEAVADSAVLTVEGADGKELAIAVVHASGKALTTGALRREMAASLPPYMLPDHILMLLSLPVGPTGKVDREALAQRITGRSANRQPRTLPPADRGHASVPAADVARTRVLDMVRDIVGDQSVGIDDAFLHVGGHSLAAARLRSRIELELGTVVRISEILGSSSIAELADMISSGMRLTGGSTLPAASHRDYSVSRAQARAMYEIETTPSVPAYQNQVVIHLPGSLTVEEISGALAAVVAAHPILLSNYRPGAEGWRVVIGDPWVPTLEVVDLRRTDRVADAQAAELDRLIREHGRIDWDLEQGRLASWRLFQVSDDEQLLSQVEHHLIHDGWSLTILLNDFLRALSGSDLSSEKVAGPQYGDYVAEEAARVKALTGSSQLANYVNQLSGVPQLPVAPSFDFEASSAEIAPALADSVVTIIEGREWGDLQAWATQQGATGFELLMAAFLSALHEMTGEDDLVIGSAVGARPSGFESTLGMFVNTVAVRSKWSTEFPVFLLQVGAALRDALDCELIPYDVILEEVRKAEGSRRAALYRCMLSAHNAQLPDMHIPSHGTALLEYRQNGTAKAPLDVLVLPKQAGADPLAPDGSVRLVWEFDSALYHVETVQAMADMFTQGLSRLAHEIKEGTVGQDWRWPSPAPAVLVGPPPQYRQLRFEPRGSSAPTVIAMAPYATQEDFAVLLNSAMRELERAGCVNGEVVAVDVGRDAVYASRLAACLTQGIVFMPVDPLAPTSRLSSILESAHFHWSSDGKLSRLRSVHDLALQPDDAYVVHTSGTTGVPKRVSVGRPYLSAYIDAFINELELTSGDVVAGSNSPLFDAFFEESFPILATGGTHLILDPSDGIPGILRQVESQQATVMDLPTALWTVLADHLEQLDERLPACVRAVVIGGEAYDAARASKFVRRHQGSVRLLSVYGPAECGISVTFHEVRESEVERDLPQLGAPIVGAVLCVLDKDGATVPFGRPGVLGISGFPCRDELRGLLRVDGLEAPVYPTGDLVRIKQNGRIDFLGRVDNQLKIRGFRISPEEVERAAGAVPGVVAVAAVGVRDATGVMRLALAIATNQEWIGALSARSQMREALALVLPEYMLPDAVVVVERLPVNAHGKVDYGRVRSMVASHLSVESGPTENGSDPGGQSISPQRVAALPAEDNRIGVQDRGVLPTLWKRMLGPEAPLDVSFIRAGGESLAAMRLMAAIEAELGIRVRVRDILQASDCQALESALFGASR